MFSRSKCKRKIGIHVDMTPMVDIMMLLVIFFMMTTAFVTVYPGFSVNLPQASAEKQLEKQVYVMIDRTGHVAVNGQSVDKEDLAAMILSMGKTTVSIQADREVRHGQVVEIMDKLRQAGIAKMTIAVEEKGRS
ncbi:ExbD/TolR family protein [Anaerosinus massiliensis]|uniref:ExbD/TolR family protein n=1 Tax=Massilibacillus massiliensis TaxID=1806837 RepID=UPI000DA6156A|nr:biopolymer transporter ExbD [Massilibacillus massiliensis]